MNIAKLNTAYDGGLILDTGSGGGNSGGGVVIKNQNKSVEITENGRTSVVHDDGFTGLGNVDVNVNVPPKNQDKTVDVVENGTLEVVADSGFTGLGSVLVNVNVPSSGGGSKWTGATIGGGLQMKRIKLGVAYANYHTAASSLVLNFSMGL
jgi:hypothetical protein